MWNTDEAHHSIMEEWSSIPVVKGIEHQARLVDLEPKRMHGVKQCRHCLTRWDRDVNAARNIFRIFIDLCTHGRKHNLFTRPTRPDSDGTN